LLSVLRILALVVPVFQASPTRLQRMTHLILRFDAFDDLQSTGLRTAYESGGAKALSAYEDRRTISSGLCTNLLDGGTASSVTVRIVQPSAPSTCHQFALAASTGSWLLAVVPGRQGVLV